jgi:hypothetical protein
MNPDRFKTAFKIRFKLPLTFGANFICKCGFKYRDESDTHPLSCPRNGSNYTLVLFSLSSLSQGTLASMPANAMRVSARLLLT